MKVEIEQHELEVGMAVKSRIRIWVTKYLFTGGIIECDAEINDEYKGMAFRINTEHGRDPCVHGNDWHRTEGEAKDHARAMIATKRVSLEKQRKALDKLEKEIG